MQPLSITIRRGDAVTLKFQMTPAAAALSGDAFRFTISQVQDSRHKILSKDCAITNAETLALQVSLTSEETNIAPRTYYCDVSRVLAGSEVCVGSGPFIVEGIARLP